jgi:hypothetical protein
VRYLLLACLIFLYAKTFSQDADSATVSSDTVDDETYHYIPTLHETDEESTHGADDSLTVSHRRFAEDKVEELKSDPEMQYEAVPTVAESLWERLLNFIAELFERIFTAATDTSWGQLFLYIGGFALVVGLIILLFKVNALKLFYGTRRTADEGTVFHENIHEMDFEALIAEATRQNDYRKGIRLVFLYSLKLLSDKQLIDWERGKTNHDYVAELKKSELKEGFNALSYYFDYAWYGNFKVSNEIFRKVELIFTKWKRNIR